MKGNSSALTEKGTENSGGSCISRAESGCRVKGERGGGGEAQFGQRRLPFDTSVALGPAGNPPPPRQTE